jgi:intracellular multiplication protein IcmJ
VALATLFSYKVITMNLLPIRLSVKRGAFRSDEPSPPGSDAVYRSARLQALKRDDYTCRFCGFRSEKNETHHANDNHDDHQVENLITACVLCHMAHHIAFAGAKNRGSLIYLDGHPIDQGGLNQLVRTLWIAEELSKGDLKSTAAQLLSRLERAEILATQHIGTTNPSVIGDFMSSLSEEDYANRDVSLRGVYLLPKKSAYMGHLAVWIKESKQFGPNDWLKKADEKFAQWTETV